MRKKSKKIAKSTDRIKQSRAIGNIGTMYIVLALVLVTVLGVFMLGGSLPSVEPPNSDNTQIAIQTIAPSPGQQNLQLITFNGVTVTPSPLPTGLPDFGTPTLVPTGFSAITGRTACPNVVDPAYFYPPTFWPELLASTDAPSTVGFTFNPASGPGATVDPNLLSEVQAANAKNMPIYAYVYTSYGTRSLTAVEADVNTYKNLYGLTNIMFDEMSPNASELSYYQSLVNYVHTFSPGSHVILNPGTYPDVSYMTLDATINVFEGPYTTFINTAPPAYAQTTPSGQMSVTVYATPANDLTQALVRAQTDNAGTVYITDNANTGNPYNTLPAYWTTELSQIAANCNTGNQ